MNNEMIMLATLLRDHPEYVSLNQADLERLIEMTKKEKILKDLGYKIWQNPKDGRWYTHYNDKGRRKLISRKEKFDLIDFLLAEKEKIVLAPSFNDLYDRWVKVQGELVSNNTQHRYNTDKKRFFSCPEMDAPLSSLTESHWKAFFIRTIKELKLNKKAAKTLVNTCKRVMKQGMADKIIQENPLEHILPKDFYKITTTTVRPQEKVTATEEQLDILKNMLYESLKEKPAYSLPAAVLLSIHTGMRVGEIAALRWDHLYLDEPLPYILIECMEVYDRLTKRRYVVDHTKTMDVRKFPITEKIHEILNYAREAQRISGIHSEWVFTDTLGNRASASSISSCIQNKCKQANRRGNDLPIMSIHQMRRTYNSIIRRYTTATVAAALLGNSEEVNTEYYTFDVTSLKEKFELVNSIT